MRAAGVYMTCLSLAAPLQSTNIYPLTFLPSGASLHEGLQPIVNDLIAHKDVLQVTLFVHAVLTLYCFAADCRITA